MKVTLKDGYVVDIDEKVLDDYEFLEDLAAIDGGKGVRVISAVNKLFGDQVEKLKDHLRKDGRVSTAAMSGVILEAIQELKAKKS